MSFRRVSVTGQLPPLGHERSRLWLSALCSLLSALCSCSVALAVSVLLPSLLQCRSLRAVACGRRGLRATMMLWCAADDRSRRRGGRGEEKETEPEPAAASCEQTGTQQEEGARRGSGRKHTTKSQDGPQADTPRTALLGALRPSVSARISASVASHVRWLASASSPLAYS